VTPRQPGVAWLRHALGLPRIFPFEGNSPFYRIVFFSTVQISLYPVLPKKKHWISKYLLTLWFFPICTVIRYLVWVSEWIKTYPAFQSQFSENFQSFRNIFSLFSFPFYKCLCFLKKFIGFSPQKNIFDTKRIWKLGLTNETAFLYCSISWRVFPSSMLS
jgi:hypothetical protein